MATAKLTIENGRITSHYDRYFEFLSDDGKRYKGNGWEVEIKGRPGRIICHSEREYSDGPAICHREFRLADGLLGLAGGNVRSRYAYFRKKDFQIFLKKFGITAVKKVDPNGTFESFVEYSGWGTVSQQVWTDGNIGYSHKSFPAPGGNPNLYSGIDCHTVTGATWAIVDRYRNYQNDRSHAVILYTLEKDVMNLEESLLAHPKFEDIS